MLPDSWFSNSTVPASTVVPAGTVASVDPLNRVTTSPPAATSCVETLASSIHSLPESVPTGFGRNSLIRRSPGAGAPGETCGLGVGAGEAATAVPGVASTSKLANSIRRMISQTTQSVLPPPSGDQWSLA